MPDPRRGPNGHLRGFAGILQADAYADYRQLYEPGRSQGPVAEALYWSHLSGYCNLRGDRVYVPMTLV